MAEITYYTESGLKKLKDELLDMETKQRPKISQQIADARDKGDLSENAEYDAAKEAQGIHEARIAQLEATLASVRVLDKKDLDLSRVSVLSTITLLNMKTNKEVTYQLVSANEADLKSGKISVSSPIGKALLGKKVGEVADVKAPAGTLQFRVENISA